ncbi:MAG: hypothetical protein UY98_C0024G0004 [Candidatus Kaiserbacteria bacterium GW2011_GWA2_58_9]|uniref:Transcriptional repressor PaaX-like central Cas2-like domain-containing protein n=1 Tax=Candidatus Kaiserbacteria bacterium GW2011_GWA2_58_9 TaxID=1618672 RepID=A0A0G2BM27_9BACT|nr:MAG: hypothetical protein UY98_C0024G0004 [Candidatus Kaiserbacteria bacterium GW2011_GWA2_58_9]
MKAGKKFQRRERTIKILKMVAVGALMIGIGAVPPPWALGRILKELTMSDSAKNRRYARRKWSEIKKRGYIRSDGRSYALTQRAERILSESELWNLKIPKQKDWDQCWYLVLFDIPVRKNQSRLSFDGILRNLGLVMYQRSVWIYPHPCQGTIEQIARFYGIYDHVSYATAIALDRQASLRRHFKVK